MPRSEPSDDSITPDRKREALAAALAGESLARSEQLRAFLTFVCEMEIAGRAGELTEYLIGVKALGRAADFSPTEDSSVRTRAYELRQRLQKFYAAEGTDAVVRIELPKGSYTPRFSEVRAASTEPFVAPVVEAVGDRAVVVSSPLGEAVAVPVGRDPAFWRGILIGAAAMAAAATFFIAKLQPTAADPAVVAAWAPFLAKDSEVIVSVASPLHLLVTPYLGNVPENTPSYPAPSELYPLFSRYRSLPKGGKLEMLPVQKAVPLGTVESVTKVLSTLQLLHAQTRMLPESSSPLSALRRRSVVLFGSPWYSQSAGVLLEKTAFTTKWDEESKQVGIFGQGRREGSRYVPGRGPHGEYQEVFGLVSVLPNDHSAEGDRSIVVFSGLTSVGTHGAATFFTSAGDLRKLQERFVKDGYATWPRSFQVVVRCRASSDAQLLSYSYETHEVLAR